MFTQAVKCVLALKNIRCRIVVQGRYVTNCVYGSKTSIVLTRVEGKEKKALVRRWTRRYERVHILQLCCASTA